ncbi:cytoplasmic polyadenylation element-binding protein 2 isoform X4 [Electrophorus electricus]|uniref:cytoplasmic polyadenylation element-binding protein 2 isoform X4 n=1 Tax=Electrophorus electricus TaxID=8005 RepID=UPI0015D03B85|nr:cytoplasmic polyadenylation element-binding protein 2 isoform X4 [Electrophorus electricus]
MGDYGFGLLQTATINSSTTLFGGGVFRSYSTPSPVALDHFSATSPSVSCASAESPPFSPVAVHQQNMQDEPVRLTASHQLPSAVQNDNGNAAEPPQAGGNGRSGNRSDYDALSRFSDFKSGGRAQFGPSQSFCDLQHDRKAQRQLSHQQPDLDCQEPPPPLGEFSCHLPQPYAAEPHLGADAGHGQAHGPLLEEAATDAVSAASPSPTSVSPNKVKIRMESPSAHLINGNSTAGGGLLAGGIGAGFPNLPHQEIQNPGGGSASPTLPGFGTPWSVQTSSPPPPVSSAANASHSNALNPAPSTEPDNNFYPGIPSSINTGFFQSFSPVSANPCAGINLQGFNSPFSPQINVPPQPPQSRRSPVSPQMHPQQGAFLQQRNNYNHHQPMMKQSLWGGTQGSGWNSGGMSWGRDHRRGGGMGMPGSLSQVSPMKKPFSSNVIAPPKFPRSSSALGPKSWIEETVFRTDSNCNTLLPLQDRSRMYDSLNMHSLESSLIDIIRAEQDPLKGRSSLFPIDDGLLDDGHGNQGVPGILGSSSYPHHNGERMERFSRKVFVGGLPPDIDEDEITSSFRRFGHLVVDWPHKAESKSYFPPKGYAFLLFQEESSVQALIEACLEEDSKLYLCVSSPTIKDKPVQIRPWNLSDSDFVMDGSQPLDPRKTIFVGGVPRPLRAVELAMIMDRLYGGVCYAGIDTDPELKYPKGAGRVAFSNQQSYIAAISARFVQLQHGDIDKRVEVKPYVLDDQLCDECQGARCGGKFAPFFCANVTCLQYYCEFCWANIHSRAGREFHKPLVKEGADRPRQIHFRWN